MSEYNGWNRQVKVTNDAGTSSYAYYPDGMRYSKTVNSTLLRQVWNGTNLAYEYTLDEDDAVVPVRRYARGINAIYVQSGDAKSYYLYNAHGDVVQLTDAAGTVTQEYEYDAFGNEQNPSASDTNPLRYCGEYFDAETGTIYLRARYYQPSIGRFLSEDTHWNPANMIYGDTPLRIGERKDILGLNIYTYLPDITAIMQSGNLYVYAMNNPLRYVDPEGELVWPGEIHRAVQNHIVWEQGFGNNRWLQQEKYVSYGGAKFGFADLYDPNTGEVWEIKPNKEKYKISGPRQLQKYIDHISGASAGKGFGSERFYYFSQGKLSPLPSVYIVNYESGDDGMIYYRHDPVTDPDAVALALAMMAASIYAGSFNGSTIPIPSFG